MTYANMFQHLVLLRVDGSDADDLLQLAGRVEIQESTRRLDEVKIDFPIYDPGVDFRDTLLEDPRCQPGAEWDIRWGYIDDMASKQVRVTHFQPEFGEDGVPRMTLFLHSRGSVAARGARGYHWGNIATADIAWEIASRYGFDVDIEESSDRRSRGHGYTQPSNISDIQYLLSLAQRIHFVCYVDGNTLHYHRQRSDYAPVLELGWYAGQPSGILKSFNPTVKETRADSARAAGEPTPGTTATSASSTDGGTETSHGGHIINLYNLQVYAEEEEDEGATVATPESDPTNRRRHAEARRRQQLERVNEGTIACLGTPRIRRDTNVLLFGVGRQLSGVWHVEESTHTLDLNGYSVDAKVKRGAHEDRVRPGAEADGTANNSTAAAAEEGAPADIAVNLVNLQVFESTERRSDAAAEE